jgi:pimeloyl-ACP methyl ester carboxylesterase
MKTMSVLGLLAVLLLAAAGWAWTPDRPAAELEARYARGPADFVTVSGVRLHVRDDTPAGRPDAPVVLMLHGFGASLHTWDAWAAALATTHRVLRLDLPGAGLTGEDPSGRYDDARGIELLLALLDTRGVARATVVGHSMGGRLAWRLAAEHPGLVERLVLVAPDGFASPGFEYGKAPEVGPAVKLMQHLLPRALLKMSLEPAWADPTKLDEATVTRYHELMLYPGVRRALIGRMQQLVLQPPEPWLVRIAAPVLLVWGERDAMIPVANARDYQAVLKQSQLLVLPGVGHLPQEEDPQAAVPALLAFVPPHAQAR